MKLHTAVLSIVILSGCVSVSVPLPPEWATREEVIAITCNSHYFFNIEKIEAKLTTREAVQPIIFLKEPLVPSEKVWAVIVRPSSDEGPKDYYPQGMISASGNITVIDPRTKESSGWSPMNDNGQTLFDALVDLDSGDPYLTHCR